MVDTIKAMEESFPEDIDLEEEFNHSSDACDYDNDYDNQKLFAIYDTYLNKSDISDTETEPDLSLNDDFFQIFDKRVTRTPVTNRTANQISCLADIENRTPRTLRKSCLSKQLDLSGEESFSEPTLPWNLNDMNEKQIMDLIHQLEEEILCKEREYPQLSVKHMKECFDKQIQYLNKASEETENHFQNCLQKINAIKAKERVAFDELIGKELADIEKKMKELSKLKSDLNVIQQISSQ